MSLRGGWRAKPDAIAGRLRQRASGVAGLDKSTLMSWRQQDGRVENRGSQFGNQRIGRLDRTSTQFGTCHGGTITQRMCNAKIPRAAENGEKWVVQKKCNEHQADGCAVARADRLDL